MELNMQDVFGPVFGSPLLPGGEESMKGEVDLQCRLSDSSSDPIEREGFFFWGCPKLG